MIDDIHVPKNTYIWRVPMFQPIEHTIEYWDHIDPTRPEAFKIEEVRLIPNEHFGDRRGYSKTLRTWIIADLEAER